MKREKRTDRICALAAVLFFHILVILCTVYLCLFRTDFLCAECEKYEVSSRLGISREELSCVVEELILRVNGRDGDMEIAVTVRGESKPFFNSRDVEHVDDLAEMIKLGKGAVLFCAAGFAALLFALLRRGKGRLLCKTYLFSWPVLCGLCLAAGAWLLVDLTGFINGFHRLFFRNNRWILNPAKDMLIWLFPKGLFQDAAMRLGIWLVVIHGTGTVISACIVRRGGTEEKRK